MSRAPVWMSIITALGALATLAAPARAERPRLDTVVVDWPVPEVAPMALAGHTIYLNRCVGGCPISPGMDDATQVPTVSSIVSQPVVLPEYDAFQPGEWEETVQCVKEVYSPFGVNITDQRPPAGVQYAMVLVGGTSENPGATAIGYPGGAGVGGVASVAPGCGQLPRGVSYAFTNMTNAFAASTGSRPYALCWIIAQESAHTFGLDHQFEFTDDKRSACNDPMTYRTECGGQKFFRNKPSMCGEFPNDGMSPRQCRCGGTQNSHARLTAVFGPGESIVPAPTVAITTPAAGALISGSVIANAGSKRGVERVELIINGYTWATVAGAEFGRNGQPNPSAYQLTIPGEVPNSVVDLVVRACDDLGECNDSAVVTATKGAPCASADTCLAGQKCEQGKCYWDPPTGQLGDDCSYAQFCVSGVCQGTVEQKICTQTCVPGGFDPCPEGFDCVQTGVGSGVCFFPPEETGCCSVGADGGLPWAHAGASALVLGLMLRRRRRGE